MSFTPRETFVREARTFLVPTHRAARFRSFIAFTAPVAFVAATQACFSGGPTQSATGGDAGVAVRTGDGGPVTLDGVVVDSRTKSPVPFAVVAIEKGGLYLPISDYSKPNPAYAFGAVAGADGRFSVVVPDGVSGVHGFANDYLYRGTKFDSAVYGGLFTVEIETRPATIAKPTISGASLAPASASPGATITVHADLRAAVSTDPLSDEVILVEPTSHACVALAPPTPPVDRDHYPDGAYTGTFVAPSARGTYQYALTATTAGCANADTVTMTLVVQ